MRSLAYFFFCLVALLTACKPPTKPAMRSHKNIEPVHDVVEGARRSGTPLLTVGELKHMIGEPDVKVTVDELHRRVSDEWAGNSPEYAQTLMVRAFRKYAQAKGLTQGTWHDKDFLNSIVWLYRWDDPEGMYEDGLTSHPVGQFSYYFIVSGDSLIGAGRVMRNEE